MNSEDASPSAQGEPQSCAAGASNADDATSPRLHERLPFERVLHLCWEERRAGKRRINARGIDRSKFGILVEAEKPIPTGTVVSVETANFTVVGRPRSCGLQWLEVHHSCCSQQSDRHGW
jgi:hypothetical protein